MKHILPILLLSIMSACCPEIIPPCDPPKPEPCPIIYSASGTATDCDNGFFTVGIVVYSVDSPFVMGDMIVESDSGTAAIPVTLNVPIDLGPFAIDDTLHIQLVNLNNLSCNWVWGDYTDSCQL